ncbi:hypothetical protein F4811DRAFT_547720 [Daldinia bambusicola]|nr:hypothetical protein F4811DRAFT_547720 [Daldinia bambusicola]
MENQRALRSRTVSATSGVVQKRQSDGFSRRSSNAKRQRTQPREDEEMQDVGNLDSEGEDEPEDEIIGDDNGDDYEDDNNNYFNDDDDRPTSDDGKGEDREDSPDRFKSGRPKKGVPGKGVRSKQWNFFKEHIIKGAKSLPGSVLTYASTMTSQLADRITYSKTWTRNNRPVVTMEVLLSRLPKEETSDSWTQEKEEGLKARFQSSPLRAYTARKREVHNHFWSLWRKTCQLRGIFPTDVIGAKEYLEYGEKVEVARGVWESNPNWPRAFCEALDLLVIASPCRADMGMLSLFIRYAVACSINDRRYVPMDASRLRNPYFHKVEDAMKRAKGSMSLPEIGSRVRQLWKREGLELPWEARVLSVLERDGFDEETEPLFQEEGAEFRPYAVTTDHLKLLTQAFKAAGDLGVPMFSDMEERFRVVSNSRTGKDAPKDWKDLTKLRLPLLLEDMRVREKRLLETDPVVALSPDQYSMEESGRSSPENASLSLGNSGDSVAYAGPEHHEPYEHEVPELEHDVSKPGAAILNVPRSSENEMQIYTGGQGDYDRLDWSVEEKSSRADPLSFNR